LGGLASADGVEGGGESLVLDDVDFDAELTMHGLEYGDGSEFLLKPLVPGNCKMHSPFQPT
jgi:hypothetical protein